MRKNLSSNELRPLKGKPNFSTLNLHKGMNNSSFYRTMVSSHLKDSGGQNHVLHCASTKYTKGFRSRSVQNEKHNNNPEVFMPQSIIYDEASARDAQNMQVHNLFSQKLSKKPTIENELRHAQDEKKQLEKAIMDLRKGINDEKKKITKITLNCDHIKNQIELTKQNTKKVEQINRNLAVQISHNIMENNDLEEVVHQICLKNDYTKNRVREQKQWVEQLKNFKEESQIELRKENKEFNKWKGTQMKEIKSMLSSFAFKAQLEEEKAHLLNQIDNNYSKNAQ